MSQPLPAFARPQYAYARSTRGAPARRNSVAPNVLVSMALDGPNPRRRPALRLLRLLAILGAMALCGAFWLAVSDAALRVLG